MSRISLLHGTAPPRQRAPARCRAPSRPSFRPQVECLENRWCPGSVLPHDLAGVSRLGLLPLEDAVSAWSAAEPTRAGAPGPAVSAAAHAAPTSSHESENEHERNEAPPGAPLPIPGGFANPTGGPFVHFNFPGPADAPPPDGNDPSLITNFNGDVGVAHVQGTGRDGHGTTLYFDADLRFMSGAFRDVNGHQQEGTFVFTWLDVYPSQSDLANQTNQLHDFNPGFGAPVDAAGDRVFWVAAVPEDSIRQDNPGAGKAELRVNNLAVRDFGSLGNALAQGSSVAATVSFDVVWTGHPTRHVNVSDAAHGFAGTYAETQARVTWWRENGFTFTSNAASTSMSLFAETGHERNGTFFA